MKSHPDTLSPGTTVGLVPAIVIRPAGSVSILCFTGLAEPLPETARLTASLTDGWRARSWSAPGGYAGVAVVGTTPIGSFSVVDPEGGRVRRVGIGGAFSTEATDFADYLLGTGIPAPELLHFLGDALSQVGPTESARRFLAELLLQISVADGYVEVAVRPERGGLFLQGWARSGLSGPLYLHGGGRGVAATAATFERGDVQSPAAGFCIYAADWQGPLQENGRLFVDHARRLLRLDVLSAPTQICGDSATEHVRAILPRLSAPPRSLEAFRRIARPSFTGRNTLAEHGGPVTAAIDRIFGTPSGGLFVSGWLLDPLRRVTTVSLKSTRGLHAPLDARWHRSARPDLIEAFGADPRFAGLLDPRDSLHGFTCTVLAEPKALAGAEVYLEILLKDEGCLFLPCSVTPCDGDGGAHPVVEALQPDDPALKTLIANHAAPFLATVPARPLNPARMTVEPIAGGAAGRETAAVMPLTDLAHLQPVMASLADTPEAAELDLVLIANREGAVGLSEELDHQFRFFGLRGSLVLVPEHETLAGRLDAGAQIARSAEILVWQPTVLPKSRGWLAALRGAAAELGERAVVAPLLGYEDGSVYFGGGSSGAAPSGAACSLVGLVRRRLDLAAPRAAQAIPAEVFLAKRGLIATAGGFLGGLFGERFVGQDLSQRLKRAGAEAWCIPAAEFWMLDATPAHALSGTRTLVDRIDAALIAQRTARAAVAPTANGTLETGGLR